MSQPLKVEEAASVLDDIAGRSDDVRQVSRLIAERYGASPPEEAKWVRAAFDYALKFGGPKKGESAFVPMIGFEGGDSYPPRLEDLQPAVKEYWKELVKLVRAPLAISRLAHLLLETSPKSARVGFARKAAAAYLEVASTSADDLDRLQALRYATSIALAFGLEKVLDSIPDLLRDLALAILASDEQKPGVVIPAIELLDSLDDPHADEVLSSARNKYAKDPYNLEPILNLQRRRTESEDVRREIDRARVKAWIDLANESEPLVRVLHLETASRLATELGITDLRDEAQRSLQALRPEDVPMEKISAEVEIPREAVEEFLNSFLVFPSWQEALIRWAAGSPPSGDIDENRKAVERASREAPLSSMMPHVRLGGDRLPRFRPMTDQQIEDERLAQQETFRLQIMTGLLADALDRIRAHYGPLAVEDLESLFEELPGLAGTGDAAFLAEAYERYWDGDVLVGFPLVALIERLVRALVLKTDVGIYRVQRDKSPGQYPGLGFLLQKMRDGLDPSWFRFLWTFLSSPAGVNFRNELFHGFVRKPARGHVLLLLISATYLSLLDVSTQRDDGERSAEQNQ